MRRMISKPYIISTSTAFSSPSSVRTAKTNKYCASLHGKNSSSCKHETSFVFSTLTLDSGTATENLIRGGSSRFIIIWISRIRCRKRLIEKIFTVRDYMTSNDKIFSNNDAHEDQSYLFCFLFHEI